MMTPSVLTDFSLANKMRQESTNQQDKGLHELQAYLNSVELRLSDLQAQIKTLEKRLNK